MSDNVAITPGAGATVAADNVGGVLYQRVKIAHGVDGAAVDASNTDPLPVRGTRANAGTDTAAGSFHHTVGGSDGTNLRPILTDTAGRQIIADPALVITGPTAQTAVQNNVLEVGGSNPTDIRNYRSGAVQIISTGTGGTFIFEQSLDGTNWVACPVYNATQNNPVPLNAAITATASAIIYTIPLRGVFFRIRIATAITGGNIQAIAKLSTDAWTPTVTAVVQSGAANLQATVVQATAASLQTTATLAAGTALSNDVGIGYRANVTSAATPTNINSPATPVGQSIKAAAGRLIGCRLTNTGAASRFVKFFNATTVTPGTTAAVFEAVLPVGGSVELAFEGGIGFATGIMIMITGARGLTDATAITANDVTGFTVHS